MSYKKDTHVEHEFIPKLLRRKVEVALTNRDAFVKEILDEMAPLILANRNWHIAQRTKRTRWAKFFTSVYSDTQEIVSVEEALALLYGDYDKFNSCLSVWGPSWTPAYPLVFGPHYAAVSKLDDRIQRGSKWIVHQRDLLTNLKHSASRRVFVSEQILTSIVYWAAKVKPVN